MSHLSAGSRRKIRLWLHLIALVLIITAAALVAGLVASRIGPSLRWCLALGFAVVIGQIACPYFLWALRHQYMKLPKPPAGGVPPSVIGIFEATAFTVAIGASYANGPELEGIFTIMALWLGGKMLAGWNRNDAVIVEGKPEWEQKRLVENRARGAISALLAGALNLVIAIVAGNIAAGETVVGSGLWLQDTICQILCSTQE